MLDFPSTLFIFNMDMATVDFNILNILSDRSISDNIKFREYCRFYMDLNLIDCINFPKSVLKLKEVLDDSIQEFYPEFQIYREFFKITKVLLHQSITSFNLSRIEKLYLFFNGDKFNLDRNIKTFKYDLSNNLKEIVKAESKPFSLTIEVDEQGFQRLYHRLLPCGYYYDEFPVPSETIDMIRDIKLFTEGSCRIFYKSGGEIIEINYEK